MIHNNDRNEKIKAAWQKGMKELKGWTKAQLSQEYLRLHRVACLTGVPKSDLIASILEARYGIYK